jgi:transposase
LAWEAGGGAHYWARRLRAHGHAVTLMAPQCVKPSVQAHNNDRRDAEAIAEAVTRPTMRVVPIKDVDQQDLQALQRVRERLMGARTALVNAVHGRMNAYGRVMPKGGATCRHAVVEKLEAEQDTLSALSRELLWKLGEEFSALEKQRASYQEQLDTLATTPPECQRLLTLPGIGPVSATALVAASSEASACKNGRQCAAGLGLVPRQHSTGGQARLLGMSQRGESSLRKLLIHGARATLRWVALKTDRRSQWIRHRLERRGTNRTAVAVANKQARRVCALLTRHQDYQPATSSGEQTRVAVASNGLLARICAAL